MNTFIKALFGCIMLISCSKEKNFTFIEAKLNGEAKAMPYVAAESTTTYVLNDTVKYFTILGISPGVGKIMLQIEAKELSEKIYYIGYQTDSIFFIKATFEKDSTFYSTTFTDPKYYQGQIKITKIENGYIKGIFDFYAFTKDTTKNIFVSEGKFYSELKK